MVKNPAFTQSSVLPSKLYLSAYSRVTSLSLVTSYTNLGFDDAVIGLPVLNAFLGGLSNK